MTSEVLIGTLCGVGLGVFAGIVFAIFFMYWKKKQNEKLVKNTRGKTMPGRAIVPQDIPDFQIPPIVPIRIQTAPTPQEIIQPRSPSSPALSPPPSPRYNETRRPSVHLEDILTSVSACTVVLPKSPTSISSTNEAAIANLYSAQKKATAKKGMLRRSGTSSLNGKLEFSLFYDQNLQELQIYLVRGIQIYVPGSDETTSLFLKAVILFDGEQVWQDRTRVVEDGTDPDFSEQLIVHGLSLKMMRKGILKLVVMDKRTDEAVGEVVYALSNLPFNFFTTEVMKLLQVDLTNESLTEEVSQCKHNGELLISMSHNRNEKKLNVVVECARNLPDFHRGNVDSYVKVEIVFVGKNLYSRTTPVFAKTRNPQYGAEFDFSIPDDKLPQITIVFKVKHHGRFRDQPIGMVKLGYDADRETEYQHLEQVLDKPHLSIQNWHTLRKYK